MVIHTNLLVVQISLHYNTGVCMEILESLEVLKVEQTKSIARSVCVQIRILKWTLSPNSIKLMNSRRFKAFSISPRKYWLPKECGSHTVAL